MRSKADQINDAFIQVLAKQNAKKYSEYIKSINTEMINNIDSLDSAKVKSIVRNQKFNIDDIALLFVIQNIILMIIGKKLNKKDKIRYAPVIAIMGIYSIKKPKKFVERIVKVVGGKGLNTNEMKVSLYINDVKIKEKAVLIKAKKIAIETTEKSIIKSKSNKRMIRDFKRLRQDGATIAKVKKSLIKKYNNVSNVERVLDTELHSQSELIRQEHSESIGFTHKTWKTQQDSRVRTTHFHDNVANKRIPIKSDFRAGGYRAQHPGDDSLPPSDRIRCRCYLEYD